MARLRDLNKTELAQYEAILSEIRSKRGKLSQWDKNFVLDQFVKYGNEVLAPVIHHCMMHEWLDGQSYMILAELWKAEGAEQMEWAMRALVSRKNFSIASVKGILAGTIPAERGTAPKPAAKAVDEMPGKGRRKHVVADAVKTESKYPTAEHIYNAGTAFRWLVMKKKEVDTIEQYFDLAGIDDAAGQLYVLKQEYR